MLNIPDSVKALYKLDSCRKNFRVHFPNGELADVTNENIMQESVHFCESVSSRDVLKFGLTEASSIEFEVVGVANMYGMTIECSSEIDCSSLSAAEIAEIEAGEWDGEYVPLADSDIGYAFFRVPYGVFRVESCPRDHQAMTHRKVTAYSLVGGEIDDKLETAKISLLLPGATYKPNLYLLGLSAIYQNIEGGLENEGFTKTEYTPSGTLDSARRLELKNTDGDDVPLVFSAYGKTDTGLGGRSDYIIACEVNTSAINDAIETAIGVLESYNIDVSASGYESYLDILKDGWRSDVADVNLIYPLLEYSPTKMKGATFYSYPITAGINFAKTTQAFYAYRTLEGGETAALLGYVTNLSIFDGDYVERHVCLSEQNGTFYKYASPESLPDVTLNFEPTNTQKVKTASGSFVGCSFDGAFSVTDIVRGFLELKAQFAAPKRTGGYRIMRLTDVPSVPIVPGEYSQMWWDEFDVEPIGTIRYAYIDDAEEEQIGNYKIGDGKSVYDMTDNALLRILNLSKTEIEAKLDAEFVPYLSPINFTPIDLSMKGLPYIEAGDALSATAQDGAVCNSYALRQEIDGIQSLTAQIDSQSGLILDSEEGD